MNKDITIIKTTVNIKGYLASTYSNILLLKHKNHI